MSVPKRQKSASPIIEATMEDALAAETALTELCKRRLTMDPAYHAAKLLRLIRQETRTFQELNDKNIQELGEWRDPTAVERARGIMQRVKSVTPDKQEEYMARTKELLQQAVTIAWAPIQLDALKEGCEGCGTVQPINIEPSILAGLGPFLGERS